jgi:hypothetical protein
MATDAPSARTGLVTADDYYVENILLVTPVNNIDIKSLVAEISYYEDIFRGSVTGHLLIADSISLIERLKMSGSDFLYLSFRKSRGETSKDARVEKFFRVYRVSERQLTNQETENYALHFCSEELLLSEQMKISKAYKDKQISDIVNDILVNQMKIPKNMVNVQDTKGNYDFVIPYKKPIEAINWLASYALSDNIGADFLFYENIQGYNFRSLQSLYSQNAYSNYMYTSRNRIAKDVALDLKAIKSYTFLDTFDSLYGTTQGAFANRLISVDPMTQRYYKTDFDYVKDYYSRNKKLNNFSILPTVKNRLDKDANQNYESVLKVMISNKDQKKAKGISETPWAVANDINAEKYVPQRTAQLALSHYSRIKIVVSGDPNLTVGRTINVELPSSISTKDGSGVNEGNPDVFNTGKYLISAVRHKINTEMKYETILEIVKDSFASPLSQFEENSAAYKAIRGEK